MKIKRFNNLWLMGLILSASILGVVYIIKIFFPNFIVGVAHLESITRIGHYIDAHKWAWYLTSTILSVITYFFYCGACCGKKKFNSKEWVIILSSILIGYIVKEFAPNIYTVLNYVFLILVPFILKADFKNTTISFSTLNILQIITVDIRGISTLIIDYNFATFLVLMIDIYIYQAVLYLYFNYERKEN